MKIAVPATSPDLDAPADPRFGRCSFFLVVDTDTLDHQVVEGAGAVGAAAIMENPERFKGRNVGVIVSGGNIDEELLKKAQPESKGRKIH